MKTLKESAKDSMEEAAEHFKTKGGTLGMVEGMMDSMNKAMKERVAYLKSLSPEEQKKAMQEGRPKMTKEEYLQLPIRDGGETPGTVCRMLNEDKMKEDAPAPVLEIMGREGTEISCHMKMVWITKETEC